MVYYEPLKRGGIHRFDSSINNYTFGGKECTYLIIDSTLFSDFFTIFLWWVRVFYVKNSHFIANRITRYSHHDTLFFLPKFALGFSTCCQRGNWSLQCLEIHLPSDVLWNTHWAFQRFSNSTNLSVPRTNAKHTIILITSKNFFLEVCIFSGCACYQYQSVRWPKIFAHKQVDSLTCCTSFESSSHLPCDFVGIH